VPLKIIQIDRGTSSHSLLQLKGRGIKFRDGSGYGDHYLHFHILIPTKLSKPERDILAAFAYLEENVSGTVKGLDESKNINYQFIFVLTCFFLHYNYSV
jgi:DnaJ-class molecular chaperone